MQKDFLHVLLLRWFSSCEQAIFLPQVCKNVLISDRDVDSSAENSENTDSQLHLNTYTVNCYILKLNIPPHSTNSVTSWTVEEQTVWWTSVTQAAQSSVLLVTYV